MALDGEKVEDGPSNLLINKKTSFRVRAYEPSGREFESLRARQILKLDQAVSALCAGRFFLQNEQCGSFA